MARKLFLIVMLSLCFSPVSHADETEAAKDYLRKKIFVVETDDQSATESLNRVSGTYDRGFAPQSATYQSENHQGSRGLVDTSDKSSSLGPGFSY